MNLQSLKSLAIPAAIWIVAAGIGMQSASAQALMNPGQLDQLVSRIALYPDPLLVQILSAATYPDLIADAADWADEHSYLTGNNLAGNNLANAITIDNLSWDPSVIALLPFPQVLDMMANDRAWVNQLGDAVLTQRANVMDAVQRMRKKAHDFGYLQESTQYHVVVSRPGIIEILPTNPAFFFLPVYDPLIVFGRPRAGLAVGITFGPQIVLGAAFVPWGWGNSGLGWATHAMVLDGHSWLRSSANRATYLHPYAAPRPSGPRKETHALRPTRPSPKGRR